MKKILPLSLLLLGLLTVPVRSGSAQDETAGPIYIVAEGDTLSGIAVRFGVTVQDLVAANNLSDANALRVGDRLVIPGLEGITGILETAPVGPGESLRSLSRLYRIPEALLIRLNRLVSPSELYLGSSLVVTRSQLVTEPYRSNLVSGETLLETAVRNGTNPWAVSHWNGYRNLYSAQPGEVLILDRPGDGGPSALPHPITRLTIGPAFQGETVVIAIETGAPIELTGSLGPYELAFISDGAGRFYGLQGIHALLDPEMLPLTLRIELPGGSIFGYTQGVRMYGRGYIFETISVAPELIDPETNQVENDLVRPYFDAVTPDKLWTGLFAVPSPFEDCINSTFGNRRSYNGSAFIYYHSGVDFCGGTGVEIYAPAEGIVVFTGPLEVRGNFTIIDHGWGVFSAYMHQSEILVEVGDQVETGQVIGLIGSTGRSTGPHLHFEIWVHGVAVNPLDWLEEGYP
ncbi:MAG TPA: peptidoglycan DD-metalloendopeptidase family protein [Anaerolineales bacterium]|nr:peptidoglycan DD-metalloendopeptidase family protein [Anaerolineales bacterium]